jgi:hypothetical protein
MSWGEDSLLKMLLYAYKSVSRVGIRRAECVTRRRARRISRGDIQASCWLWRNCGEIGGMMKRIGNGNVDVDVVSLVEGSLSSPNRV